MDSEVSFKAIAISPWQLAYPSTILSAYPFFRRQWDASLRILKQQKHLDTSTSLAECTCLWAVRERESGLWIQILSSPDIGTLLDDTTFNLGTASV